MYRAEDFAKGFGKYVWCLHCERVCKKEDWLKNKFCCPNLNAIVQLWMLEIIKNVEEKSKPS